MSIEKKVYVIFPSEDFDFRMHEQESDYESIIQHAENEGNVYSLEGFQDAINNEELFIDAAFILIR